MEPGLETLSKLRDGRSLLPAVHAAKKLLKGWLVPAEGLAAGGIDLSTPLPAASGLVPAEDREGGAATNVSRGLRGAQEYDGEERRDP